MSYYTQKLDRWLLPMVAVWVMLSTVRSQYAAGLT